MPFNDGLIEAIDRAFSALTEDVRCVLISGEGQHFCAGLDLSELSERTVYQGVLHSRMWHATLDKVQFAPVPVVAVLHGATIGGGLEIASAAHIRVAERSAYYGLPEGQRGIFVGGGGTVRIQRVVGYTVMADMMLTGRLLSATEGEREHIVRYLVPEGQALARALELAAQVAKNTHETNWRITNVLPRINDLAHDDGLFMEYLNSNLQRSPETAERLREFVEGRAAPLVAPAQRKE